MSFSRAAKYGKWTDESSTIEFNKKKNPVMMGMNAFDCHEFQIL